MKNLNEILKFELIQNNFEISEYIDDDIALVKVLVMDDRPNAHDMPISFEAMKDASSTLIGKAMVAYYNKNIDDVEGHELGNEYGKQDQIERPFGYFPKQEIEFTEDEDGFHSMYAYGVVFKSYCPEIYNLFTQKAEMGLEPRKAVSMEIRLLEKQQEFENGEQITRIKKFSFKGVTLLGSGHNPAIESANATLVSFEEKVEEIEKLFFAIENAKIEIDNSQDVAVSGSSWSNPGSALYGKLLKASNVKALVNEAYLVVKSGYEDAPSTSLSYPHHVVRDGKLVVHVRGLQAAFSRAAQQGIVKGGVRGHLLRHYRELGLDTSNFEKNDFIEMEEQIKMANKDNKIEDEEEKMELKEEEDTKKKEDKEESKVTMSDEKQMDYAKAYVDLQLEFTAFKADIANDMIELSTLRKNNADRQDAEKTFEIEQTILKVADKLPQDIIDGFRKEAKDITFENKTSFCNKIKAAVVDYVLDDKNDSEMKLMSINKENNKNTDNDGYDWYKN